LKRKFLVIEYTRVELSEVRSFFSFDDSVVGALAKNAAWVAEWRKSINTPIWQYDELDAISSSDYNSFDGILGKVLADPRVTYLLERRFKEDMLSSVFNSVVIVEKICFGAYSILKQLRAESVIFHTPPHHLHDYLFSKVATLLGLEVLVVKLSPLPWRAWVCEGVDEQRVVGQRESADKLSITTKQYIESLSGAYDKAIPEYERKLASSAKGQSLSVKADISDFFNLLLSKRPLSSVFRLLAMLRKVELYRKYTDLSAGFKLPEKFVVLFLHFQPERTSVPEGLSYSAQWLAIKQISQALPDGMKLVVKEHQAMFRRQLDPRTRDMNFYHSITQLDNVVVAPLDFDTFTLVDSSSAVVTLTGTVGFEALIRRKPVIALGVAPYKDAPGVFSPKNYTDLSGALRSLKSVHLSDQHLERYLLWVEANSSQADTLPDGANIAFFNVVAERECINKEFLRVIQC
jgi:hypothetical protein